MGHCSWANINEMEKNYHDNEWGIPVHDDRHMFEHLTLECLQCGLSWDLMMKRREVFRKCFCHYDYDRIAQFDNSDIKRIMETKGMLKAERKIRAIISNARCYQKVREEFGSFCDYLWGFTGGKTILYRGHSEGHIPVSNGLSKRISQDMKKRGFKFIGEITIYSHLQACGIINDHASDCQCFKRINDKNPTVFMEPDEEGPLAGFSEIS